MSVSRHSMQRVEVERPNQNTTTEEDRQGFRGQRFFYTQNLASFGSFETSKVPIILNSVTSFSPVFGLHLLQSDVYAGIQNQKHTQDPVTCDGISYIDWNRGALSRLPFLPRLKIEAGCHIFRDRGHSWKPSLQNQPLYAQGFYLMGLSFKLYMMGSHVSKFTIWVPSVQSIHFVFLSCWIA